MTPLYKPCLFCNATGEHDSLACPMGCTSLFVLPAGVTVERLQELGVLPRSDVIVERPFGYISKGSGA